MNEIITVKEILEYATEFELCRLAHQVFWAVSTQQINLAEDSNKLLELIYDEAAVHEMTESNVLGIGRIKYLKIMRRKCYVICRTSSY